MTIYLGDKHANFGIDRKDMPQIFSGDLNEFVAWLRKKGVVVKTTTVNPLDMRPTQSHFKKSKVVGTIKNFYAIKNKPLLVTTDGYVIDGHHRWLAFYNLKKRMPVKMVNLSVSELLEYGRDFHKSFSKGLHEKVSFADFMGLNKANHKPTPPIKIKDDVYDKEAKHIAARAIGIFVIDLRKNLSKHALEIYHELPDKPDLIPQTEPNKLTIFNMTYHQNEDGIYHRLSDAEHILEMAVEATIKDIVKRYVEKTAMKVAPIFRIKGKPSAYELLSASMVANTIEHAIQFKFIDGSHFTLNTRVIYRYTTKGRLFVQYPSRFTDVVLGDGSTMNNPSASNMVTDF